MKISYIQISLVIDLTVVDLQPILVAPSGCNLLSSSASKIASGEYKTKLRQLTLQRRNEDKAVTGFQAYYLLLVMFNVTLKGSVVYDFRHLTNVRCGGDRDRQGFLDRWDEVLNGLMTPIAEEQLEVMHVLGASPTLQGT
eukprot:448103-Amphidinium_carterae.1